MKKILTLLMLVAFSASPAALGSTVTPEQLYKTTYIDLKKNKDPAEVFNNLLTAAAQNKIDIKTVLESAVAKKWMSQEQLDTVLEVAQKNAHLVNDPAMVEKIKAGKVSTNDLEKFSQALQGEVTGAAYHCGYYGCYYRVAYVPLGILLLALLFYPVVVVVY